MNKRGRMNCYLTLFGHTMENRASRPPCLLGFNWCRTEIVPMLATYLTAILFLVGTVHALDPNKHLTQYVHTAWRTQDGSLPAGMYHIVQTSDGFLWFLSLPADIYRFDGVRFLPWRLPAGAPMDRSLNIFADHAGGLWVLGPRDIIRLKGAAVSSHFQLEGGMFQSVSEAPDGSLWILGGNSDAFRSTRQAKNFVCYVVLLRSAGMPVDKAPRSPAQPKTAVTVSPGRLGLPKLARSGSGLHEQSARE